MPTFLSVTQEEESDNLTLLLFEHHCYQAGHDQCPIADCKAVPSTGNSNNEQHSQIPTVRLHKLSQRTVLTNTHCQVTTNI